MNNYKNLIIENNGSVAKLWLNRPEVHNALNATMISELTDALHKLEKDQKVRIIILSGKGKSFCAGADIKWMQETQQMPYDKNYDESLHLSECFYSLYHNKKITIASVKGAAYGGGVGLICACDLAFAFKSAAMAFSEIKLGLVPATIAPYVLGKLGRSSAMELLLSGKSINGSIAEKIGLVNAALDETEFNNFINEYIRMLLNKAPQAQFEIKQLINHLFLRKIDTNLVSETAELISKAKITNEAKEGIKAFLGKRQPNWIEE